MITGGAWVLVLFLTAPYVGGATTVEGFSSKAMCVAAGEEVESQDSFFSRHTWYICLEVNMP